MIIQVTCIALAFKLFMLTLLLFKSIRNIIEKKNMRQGWANKPKHRAKAATQHSTVEPMAIRIHNFIIIQQQHQPPLTTSNLANYYKRPVTMSCSRHFLRHGKNTPIYLRVDHNLTKSGKQAKILQSYNQYEMDSIMWLGYSTAAAHDPLHCLA